ncbi:NAD(P)/FAD-dependent oxidoreductase [Nocardioides coralli]|uniref:NAD(P)/FAD-dependent oxidoreductase n=1 Tax=Nocardioides coralli TaxID=2872154 RepID=UPI001CA3F322|nr:NAD(P)/FAD-dependent oxidoreductase [Nocardioides coralli]QZY29958.1 NAD(P)/FAD-dependent oxidoreductase [Nocardioides coralli]
MAMSPLTHDAVVIGGGPAGLQATLTLARVHRRVLMLDSGRYRNDPAAHLHNFLTQDGTPPAELRRVARKELTAYDTVEVRDTAAAVVEPVDGGFRVELDDGPVVARGVVLATGLRDVLPEIPGVQGLWGGVIAHCPFCHGHELAGQDVAVVGAAAHIGAIMAPVASSVTMLEEVAIERVEPSAVGARVVLADGTTPEFGGVFVATRTVQAAPFAEQLGLAMLPSGCVEVDAMGRTSLPGVHAAGDMAHVAAMPMPMASVLAAAASGQVAGGAMVAHLL